jgi:asparagine synthase (glutamine-hydrolysing)
MSGILGLWNLDGRPADPALLAKMSMRLAHRGPDGEGISIQLSMGMACQSLQVTPESVGEIQPLLGPAEEMLVFDGRIDNREELYHSLEIGPVKARRVSDAALVLAAYRKYGETLPELLNGDFALAVYDPRRQMLLLARDAIGVRPLYYYRGKDFFIFASEIKALLAHPCVSTRPNDQALASLILHINTAYGGCQGITFFEDVFSVSPAHQVILTPDKFVVKQYWDFDPGRQIRMSSFDEYAEAFRQHFDKAVQRRIRSAFPVAVSVSGGLDSSSIFCQAELLRCASQNSRPSILGFSSVYKAGSPADEAEFLLAIEQQYEIEIQKIPMRAKGFINECRPLIWNLEVPLLDTFQSDFHSFNTTVRQAGAKTLLNGYWGDQLLFDTAYLIDLFLGFEWKKVSRHVGEYSQWMDGIPTSFWRRAFFRKLVRYHTPDVGLRLFRELKRRFMKNDVDEKWYTKRFIDLAYRSESQRVLSSTHPGSAHFKSFYEIVKENYYVLSVEESNKFASLSGLDAAFPFLDRDLIYFLMSIPGEIVVKDGVPKALLRHSMQGIVPRMILERQGKADFTAIANEGMERELVHFINIFQSDAMVIQNGYASSDIVKTEILELKKCLRGSNNAVLNWSLESLFALEIWLRVFFENGILGKN